MIEMAGYPPDAIEVEGHRQERRRRVGVAKVSAHGVATADRSEPAQRRQKSRPPHSRGQGAFANERASPRPGRGVDQYHHRHRRRKRKRDLTAEKYRRFDRHERMPPDWKPQRHASG